MMIGNVTGKILRAGRKRYRFDGDITTGALIAGAV